MPRLTSRIDCGSAPAAQPVQRHVETPNVYRGVNSGSIWVVTGANGNKRDGTPLYNATLVHLGNRPQKAKHQVGYATGRLSLGDMTPHRGEVCLRVA